MSEIISYAYNCTSPHKAREDDCQHLELFGKPPLFQGEEASYRDLLAKVSSALRAGDIFEQILALEYTYRRIEVVRFRRVGVDFIRANQHEGLCHLLTPIVGRSQAEALAKGWAAQKADEVKEVKKLLRAAGLDLNCVLAQTFAAKLNDIACINHMTAVAEARCADTLHEIDRHRRTLGQDLRRIGQQFEDEQLRVIESGPMSADEDVN